MLEVPQEGLLHGIENTIDDEFGQHKDRYSYGNLNSSRQIS